MAYHGQGASPGANDAGPAPDRSPSPRAGRKRGEIRYGGRSHRCGPTTRWVIEPIPFSGVFSKVSGRISDSQDQDILVGQERARFQGVHELGTRMGYDRDSRAEHPAAPGLKSRATHTKPARSRLHRAAREGFVWVAGGFSLRGNGSVPTGCLRTPRRAGSLARGAVACVRWIHPHGLEKSHVFFLAKRRAG